jgi:hypothetical protein
MRSKLLKYPEMVSDAFEAGKKQGVIEELKKETEYYENMLSKVSIELNKLKRKPIIKSNRFWASMLYVIEIQRIEKRLKELEGVEK